MKDLKSLVEPAVLVLNGSKARNNHQIREFHTRFFHIRQRINLASTMRQWRACTHRPSSLPSSRHPSSSTFKAKSSFYIFCIIRKVGVVICVFSCRIDGLQGSYMYDSLRRQLRPVHADIDKHFLLQAAVPLAPSGSTSISSFVSPSTSASPFTMVATLPVSFCSFANKSLLPPCGVHVSRDELDELFPYCPNMC